MPALLLLGFLPLGKAGVVVVPSQPGVGRSTPLGGYRAANSHKQCLGVQRWLIPMRHTRELQVLAGKRCSGWLVGVSLYLPVLRAGRWQLGHCFLWGLPLLLTRCASGRLGNLCVDLPVCKANVVRSPYHIWLIGS